MRNIKVIFSVFIFLVFLIVSPSLFGLDTSPGQYKFLPEVIWAPATGGGTWVSDIQIIDFTGGSVVKVSFCYGGGNVRGGTTGFTLWTGSGVGSSTKIVNILSALQGIDSGFTYYGRVGTLVLQTQDAAHVIHAAVRTYNGNYSKTFPGLSPVSANTAALTRPMVIQNLTNNATYRSTAGFFCVSLTDPVTADFSLINSSGAVIGNTFTKSFVALDYKAFSPFNEAGVPYPTYSYDNVWLRITPTSGAGELMCFGASANNATNDPASHLAVQANIGAYNSPAPYQFLPEGIWAPATGGGTWVTDVQITDMTGGSQVYVYFNYGGGNWRGGNTGFLLWTSPGQYCSTKITNILQAMQALDPSFNYFGRVGAVDFTTTSSTQRILISARTYNGNYSKTFPGLRWADTNNITAGRPMLIQDLTNNSIYRSTCGVYNPNGPCVLEFRLIDGTGALVGNAFQKSLQAVDFMAFSPFTEAGVPYPTYSYDNVHLEIWTVSGAGIGVACFGASANNNTNDPAAHIAVVRN